MRAKTYIAVYDRYGGKCAFPGCGRRDVEYSHIVFRSHSRLLADDPDNGILLCPDHHRLGRQSVHRSRWWRYWYYRFLPERIRKDYPWESAYCENNLETHGKRK